MGIGQAESSEDGPSDAGAAPSGSEGPALTYRYTPLFRAQHDPRYRRQNLIRKYEEHYDCNLVVMIDQITQDSVTYLAECLHDVDPTKNLHLLLCSPGGDPETAIRLIRMAQAVSREFVIVVPEQAKSAATIMCLGANEILLGATSDLGPIDPQILVPDRGFVSAKDLIAAVEAAITNVAANPDTYPIHAAMLGGIDAPTVQFARSALDRTGDIARQAIASNPDRDETDVATLLASIQSPLIDAPKTHGALVGATEALEAGLPVTALKPDCDQWRAIWELWTQYFAIAPNIAFLRVYEGRTASQVQELRSMP